MRTLTVIRAETVQANQHSGTVLIIQRGLARGKERDQQTRSNKTESLPLYSGNSTNAQGTRSNKTEAGDTIHFHRQIKNNKAPNGIPVRFRSVVVITFALHAKGRGFETRRDYSVLDFLKSKLFFFLIY